MARRSNGGSWQLLLGLAVVIAAVQVGKVAARWIEQDPGRAALAAVVVFVLLVGGLAWVIATRDHAAARQAALERSVSSADGLSGPEFEQWFARLLARSGFTGIKVSGGAGDLGADVIATSPLGKRAVFQCKRYSRNVPDKYVQQFAGTCRTIHRANIAAIVTTAGFTKPAWRLARRLDIVLVDRAALAAWAVDHAPPKVFGGSRGSLKPRRPDAA